MELIQAFWLALIQGVTEFLPISSSGHLVLASKLFGWPDQGLAFDVAVHVGSLCAVLFYFRDDIVLIIRDSVANSFGAAPTSYSRLGFLLALAVIPICITGFLFSGVIETNLRNVFIIAAATALFGLLLWWSDWSGSKEKNMSAIGVREALIIGVAQILALIPGTSRSGITMTAALALGFDRQTSARFSFLLSIPTIFAAGTYKGWQLWQSPESVPWGAMFIGILVSAVSAYFCVRLFLKIINRIGMFPFMTYRLLLGIFLLLIFL